MGHPGDTDGTSPAERAGAGVRGWVRRAGAGLRTATPYGILAFLTASAVAPVAGAALGAQAEYAAALDQLGGMGGNYLADTLTAAARRMRDGDTDPDRWHDAVATELLARLDAGDERAAALRDEMAALLHAVDAVGTALRAADEHGQESLARVFGALGEDIGRLQILADDATAALAGIQRELAEQGWVQRQHTDLLRQSLVAVAYLRQEVLRRGTAPDTTAPPDEVAAPAGAVSPYPGLRSFRSGDARWFRGREALVADLLGRLSEHLVGGPPVVVVGVSGVGKSSLLHAGVLPALADGGLGDGCDTWPWLVMTPGAAPLAELTGRAAVLAGDDPDAALAEVRDDPAAFGALAARAGGDGRLVVVVDQFEELFTQCAEPAERQRFAAALAAAAPALVTIAIRADFYPQCTGLPALVPMLAAGQVVAGPLAADDLRRAIREPAAAAGLTVEPGLADLLLTDLGAPDYQPGALPLLAHALRATWERREGTTLTVAAYRRTGGIRRAVAETAERIYLGLGEPGRAALRAALLSLVTVVDGVAVRRRSTPLETDVAVLRPMIEARLVTTGRDAVEISHEALLTGWPRLASWLVEAREEILLRQRLGQAAGDWAASGEEPDALYRGVRLAAARVWAAGRTDVPDVQRRFLAASEAAAQAQELAQRRTNRRLRRLVAALGVALLLVAAGGVVVWRQQVQAERDSREARSRQWAAEARTVYRTDPDRSARLALAAWEAAPTPEARSALLYAQHTAVVGRLGDEAVVPAVAVSPDGRHVAVGGSDGRVQIWDATTQEPVGAALHHPAKRGGSGEDAGEPAIVDSLAFSPDGRFLAGGALGHPDGVAVWDVPGGTLRRTFPGVGSVAWLPDTSAVLAGRVGVTPPRVDAWDPVTGRATASFAVEAEPVLRVAVSPDGRYLAVTNPDGGEILRRTDGKRLARLDVAKLSYLGFAAGGTLFGNASDGRVRAWRPDSGWRQSVLNDPVADASSSGLAVTRDGTAIVGGDRAGELLAYTVGGPRVPLNGYPHLPYAMALSADDRLLAVVSPAVPPHLIRLGDVQLPHPQIAGHLAFDPAGESLATASNDQVVRVWDPRTGALRHTVAVPGGGGLLGMAYAPDGTLAVTVADGRIVIVDQGHRVRQTVRVPAELYPGRAEFSPDGALLAVVAAHRDPEEKGSATIQEQDDPEVFLFDARTWQERGSLRLPGHQALDVAFTPDGTQLLVGSNRLVGARQLAAIWRYRLPDRSLIDRRDVPGDGVSELAVSPDGALVALAHGRSVPVLRVDGLAPAGALGPHPEPVRRVAWSPDGRTLATGTGNFDDVTRLWDVRSDELVAEVRGNSGQTGGIAFSPDGRMLAAGTGDWNVALWRLDPAEAVERICAMLVPASRHGGDPLPKICR